MYSSIRLEEMEHSHVMEYAGGLIDGIGERLTGSPSLDRAHDWCMLQLCNMGASNVHLEDWGVFGVGWRQRNAWVHMVSPDFMIFVAQAAPWSASSHGAIKGDAIVAEIEEQNDIERYRGKLGGKIVFLGRMRDVPPPVTPISHRYTTEELAAGIPQAAVDKYFRNRENRLEHRHRAVALERKIAEFLKSEKIAAAVLPSQDSEAGGGTGILFVDESIDPKPWISENALPFPVVVTAIENYGRVYRLLQHGVRVSVELNVDVETNVIASTGSTPLQRFPVATRNWRSNWLYWAPTSIAGRLARAPPTMVPESSLRSRPCEF
jgi:hypothetical protein